MFVVSMEEGAKAEQGCQAGEGDLIVCHPKQRHTCPVLLLRLLLNTHLCLLLGSRGAPILSLCIAIELWQAIPVLLRRLCNLWAGWKSLSSLLRVDDDVCCESTTDTPAMLWQEEHLRLIVSVC